VHKVQFYSRSYCCSLEVIIDSHLTMSAHATVCCAAHFQLRQIRLVARALSIDAVRTLVQAFISCRLDYCNSLLCGVTCFNVCSRCRMQQLGSLQAFGVVTTSLLSSDNFIGCRLDSGSTSNWLSSCIRRCVTQRHSIWSKAVSSSQTLVDADYGLQTSTLVSFRQQERALMKEVSRLLARGCTWNSLPAELRQPDVEMGQFRRLLKTFLFARDCGAWRLLFIHAL